MEASIITIILFFVYTWGLGFGATYFFRKPQDFFERNIMRIGIGLCIMALIVVLLSFFGLPIDWKIFLALSLAIPLYAAIRKMMQKKSGIMELLPKISLSKKSLIILIIAFVLFGATFYMYASGSFGYPYFEDDDPWSHAGGIMYVKYAEKVTDPLPDVNLFPYLGRQYPPGYDGIMGVLHQTSTYRMWTLKFFNSLIISLGILFFFFFAKRLMKNSVKALFATFILASIPCYLSHFIWAHALIPTLLFPFIYCIDLITEDKRYAIPAALMFAGFCVIQPDQAMKVGIMSGIFILVKSVRDRRFLLNLVYVLVIGGLLSLTWWYNESSFLLGSKLAGPEAGATTPGTGSTGFLAHAWDFAVKMFPPGSGTATREYRFHDLFLAKTQNMINNPIGIGVGIYILLMLCLALLIVHLLQKGFAKLAQLKSRADSTIGTFTLRKISLYISIVLSFVAAIPLLLIVLRLVLLIFIPLPIPVASGPDLAPPPDTFLFKLQIDLAAMLLVALSFIFYHLGSAKYRNADHQVDHKAGHQVDQQAVQQTDDNHHDHQAHDKDAWILVALLWLLFTFLGINSLTFHLPLGSQGFRFWMLFAIPVAMLAAEGAWLLAGVLRPYRVPRTALLLAFCILVLFTAAWQKYELNTMAWSPGAAFASTGQLGDYLQLRLLPPETPVFTFERGHRFRLVSFDKYSCEWCSDVIEFRNQSASKSVEEIHDFLKSHNYGYAIAGVQYVREQGDAGAAKLNELISSPDYFSVVYPPQGTKNPTSVILRVK